MSEIIIIGNGFRFAVYSGPVQDFLDRVIAADVAAGNNQGLEDGVKNAYDVFISACLNTGELGSSGGVLSQANSLIKASCPMMGARTISGALVPLVGTAPTRFGTEAGWNYNRKTGLAGNGTDNYLDTNRNNNAEPQNNKHFAMYIDTIGTRPGGSGTSLGGGNTQIARFGGGEIAFYLNSSTAVSIAANSYTLPSFLGASRNNATQVTRRMSTATIASLTTSNSSQTPASGNILLYKIDVFSSTRTRFYSIGESLDLAPLDSRVTALTTAISAAIP